jgi:cyclic pyranopterin phosphate synthase
MPRKLSHLDSAGRANMVDVSHKPVTRRTAIAEGFITLQPATLSAIAQGTVPKGEVLSTARLAGIIAAKRTADLIPLAHPLPLESIEVHFHLPSLPPEPRTPNPEPSLRLRITATARVSGKTGVEMEALTAVAVAALTIYDMCKAIDKTMTISDIRLLKKTK